MIQPWLITASAPICGTDTYYLAFSDGEPLDKDGFPYSEITDELWDNYSHLTEDYYDEEDEEQVRENWNCDCNFSSEELDPEELEEWEDYGIIYDER
jgi:hypothetical protein